MGATYSLKHVFTAGMDAGWKHRREVHFFPHNSAVSAVGSCAYGDRDDHWDVDVGGAAVRECKGCEAIVDVFKSGDGC
jgi:hypothetical protein